MYSSLDGTQNKKGGGALVLLSGLFDVELGAGF